MFEGKFGIRSALITRLITKKQKEKAVRRHVFQWKISNFFQQRWREIPIDLFLLAKKFHLVPKGVTLLLSEVWGKKIAKDGTIYDYGLLGRHVVTTVGKQFLVDAFQNLVELEIMNYHGLGTGTTAAVVGDTALETEWTTEYTGDVRATGTQSENGATTYQTQATNTKDTSGTSAVTEWGLLSQAATGGGVLFDRQVFAAVNLGNGDSFQTTGRLTAT